MKKMLIFTVCLFFLGALHADAAVTFKIGTSTGSLVAWWRFDEGTSTLAHDFSGNGNNIGINNISIPSSATSGWASGKRGRSIKFDGINDYAMLASTSAPTLQLAGDYTISMWVKLTSNGSQAWFAKSIQNSGIGIYFGYGYGGGGFIFGADNAQNSPTSIAAPTDVNQWHFLTGVKVGSTRTLYVDGVLIGSASGGSSSLNNNGNYWIGSSNTSANGTSPAAFSSGYVDDVRIYNKAFGTSDVLALYKSNETVLKTLNNNGLAAYWSLDEGTSTYAGDMSGNNNKGLLSNFSFPASAISGWSKGKRGGGLIFDGSNDFVTAPNATNLQTSAASYSIWMKPAVTISNTGQSGSDVAFIRKQRSGNGYIMEVYGSGASNKQLAFWTNYPAGVAATYTLNAGTWYNVVGTYDGVNAKLYVNGTQVATNPDASTGSNSDPVDIGTFGQNSRFFNGVLDDARIYDRALSADEVAALYKQNQTKINAPEDTRQTNGLVGYWTFNGKDILGTTALDISGQAFHGTLTGGPTAVIGKVGQALSFSGANTQYVDSGLAGNFTGNFTAIAWVRKTVPFSINNYTIMGNRNGNTSGWELEADSAGKLVVRSLNGGSQFSVTAASGMPYNEWVQVATTVSDTSANGTKLYVNGVLNNQGTLASTPASGSQPFRIGYIGVGSGGSGWDGYIDEVRLYNRVLSATEINQLYLIGK